MSHGPRTGQESWGYRVIRSLDGGTSLYSTVCQPGSAGTELTSSIWTQTRVKEEMELYTRWMNLCRIYSQQMKTELAVINNCIDFSNTEKTKSLNNELSPTDVTDDTHLCHCTLRYLAFSFWTGLLTLALPLGSHFCLLNNTHELNTLNWSLWQWLGVVAIPSAWVSLCLSQWTPG